MEAERERVEVCVKALLALAADRGLEITRTKLAKLLYLADLRSVEHDGITGSGAAWRWQNYGPFDNVLLSVENSLVEQGVIDRKMIPWGMGDKKRYRLSAADMPADMSDDFVAHLEAVLDEKGHWTAKHLKNHAYGTPPMMDAQENDKFGELLDFTTMGHLTLADIDESIGKGPDYDPRECTFHASTEDFISSLGKP